MADFEDFGVVGQKGSLLWWAPGQQHVGKRVDCILWWGKKGAVVCSLAWRENKVVQYFVWHLLATAVQKNHVQERFKLECFFGAEPLEPSKALSEHPKSPSLTCAALSQCFVQSPKLRSPNQPCSALSQARGNLTPALFEVIYAHGSGGCSWDNFRICRMMARMGMRLRCTNL